MTKMLKDGVIIPKIVREKLCKRCQVHDIFRN